MFSISSPPDELADSCEIAVIGSGYGGAITASRFARAGRDVCVLERGEEFLPGEYPDTKVEAAEEIQLNTSSGRTGSRTGLYDFKVNEDISALVGCGLGGTSLINANVVEEPKDEVFDQTVWPEPLRNPDQGPFSLRDGFQRAREMLEPQPYPDDAPDLPKLEALRKAANGTDGSFSRPDIAVTFEDRVNAAGVRQKACTQCGDCVSGCNYDSKNTLLMNYLPDAWNHGARLFTNIEVQYLERSPDDGWLVHYEVVGRGREQFSAPGDVLKANQVVLAAGSLGSTEILLRSAERGLPVSSMVGEKFSGNADVLGFAYNADQEIRGVGMGDSDPSEMEPVGPCIAGLIDVRQDDRPLEEQFVIEEGVAPGALGDVLPTLLGKAAMLEGEDTDSGFFDYVYERGRELQSFVFGSRSGAINNTETFLGMGHDGSDGQLKLRDGQIRIDWPDVGERDMFHMINASMKNATKELGGTYLENPVWTNWFDHQLMTVHPLGGCPVGNDARHGAVDHRGRVFTGRSDNPSEVYDDLMVCDGSMIPGSVGINPLLTISALTERACALKARDEGWSIDYSPATEAIDPPESRPTGVRFTEKMAGPMAVNDPPEDFQKAANQGRRNDDECQFVVTVTVDDVDALLGDPAYKGSISGTVEASFLSEDPLSVRDGTFQLAAPVEGRTSTRHMFYRLLLLDRDGQQYTLIGKKELHDDFGPDIWGDTTTLFTTLYRGSVNAEETDEQPFARGILRLGVRDLIKQLQTIEATGTSSASEKYHAIWRFGRVFAGTIFEMYGGIADTSPPGSEWKEAKTRRRGVPSKKMEPSALSAGDGQALQLDRWKGGDRGPVLLLHDLGFSGRLFRAERMDQGPVEYLTSNGYDVWVPDLRISTDLPDPQGSNPFEAVFKQDLPAILEEIADTCSTRQVDAIGHGWGGYILAAFLCAPDVAGDTRRFLRSALFSQIATEPVFRTDPAEGAGLYRPDVREQLGISSLTEFAEANSNWIETLLSRTSGDGAEENWWKQTGRGSIHVVYGPLLEPKQVSQGVIEALDMLIGDVAPSVLDDLARLLEKRPIQNADLSEQPISGIPVTFVHGRRNSLVQAESTKRLDERLQSLDENSPCSYHLVSGYGHFDAMVGPATNQDVYSLLDHHLTRSARSKVER